MKDKTILRMANIEKMYGQVEALRGANIEFQLGEIHAIVGDNGAGKSTLVKIISGATGPTSGKMFLEGTQVSFAGPRDAAAVGISTVYQNLALVGIRDIAENVYLGREPTRLGFVRKKYMHEEAYRAVSSLRQMNVTNTYTLVQDLSGGQRQAVAIAREIHTGAKLLLLDEPTAALGVRETRQVIGLIKSLLGPQKCIVLISHNLNQVFELATRVSVMRTGRVVRTFAIESVTPDDVVAAITGASDVE